MSGQTQNWTIPTDARAVMQATEKRLATEERRPRITKASDLLGPGLAPYAVENANLDGEVAAFNGFWYVPVGALGSPDDTLNWMAQTIATAGGGGVQVAWTYQNADAPHQTVMRGFEWGPGLVTRFYSNWQSSGGGDGDPAPIPLEAGFIASFPQPLPSYRLVTASLVKLSGAVVHFGAPTFGTSYELIGILPPGFRCDTGDSDNKQNFRSGSGAASTFCSVRVDDNGGINVRANAAGTGTCYLDGILVDLKSVASA